MLKIELDLKAGINGIYLNSETIDMLSIVQCQTMEELKTFVKNCSQLSIDEYEIEALKDENFEEVKRSIFKQYKGTLISLEQSIKNKRSVLKSCIEHGGIDSEKIESYISTFEKNGVDGIKELLLDEHLDSYSLIAEKVHRFIASERDQMKSLTYDQLLEINNVLSDFNTILVASGRYYDVTNKLYTKQVKGMPKYDFYFPKRGLDFCYKNNLHARYHTLLDKQTMEEYFSGIGKEEIIKELKEYVKQSIDFVSRYNEEHKINGRGVIVSLDLFNEIISFDPPYRNMWKELYGISNQELENIFQYALDNKPEGVTYVYNEPFLENSERRMVVLEQLRQIDLLSPGLIDTIGTQMHIELSQSVAEIKKCFNDLKQSGFNIQITEFDMCIPERNMFNENGRERTETEIVELYNQKCKEVGKPIRFNSIAEMKKIRIKEISDAIKKTGISLEGVTYWSITDTLDHNLQRTNTKTFAQNVERDIATTRYAGLYLESTRENVISKSNRSNFYDMDNK